MLRRRSDLLIIIFLDDIVILVTALFSLNLRYLKLLVFQSFLIYGHCIVVQDLFVINHVPVAVVLLIFILLLSKCYRLRFFDFFRLLEQVPLQILGLYKAIRLNSHGQIALLISPSH